MSFKINISLKISKYINHKSYTLTVFLLLIEGHGPNAAATSCQTCISAHSMYKLICSYSLLLVSAWLNQNTLRCPSTYMVFLFWCSAAWIKTAHRNLQGKCVPPPRFGGTKIAIFKMKNYDYIAQPFYSLAQIFDLGQLRVSLCQKFHCKVYVFRPCTTLD